MATKTPIKIGNAKAPNNKHKNNGKAMEISFKKN